MTHTLQILIASIGMIMLGIAGQVFVSRRRFYRRNQAGIEEFASYRSAFGAAMFERLVVLVCLCLILTGLLLGLFSVIALLN